MYPSKYNITAYRGDYFEQKIIIKAGDLPLDLTGETIKAQIRQDTDITSPKLLDFTVARVDLEGSIALSLAPELTQGLDEGSYVYDLQVGNTTQLYGDFILTGDVSR